MSDIEQSVNRMVGVLICIQGYIEEGFYNPEGLDEMRLLGFDLADAMAPLIEHVKAQRQIPESWLRTDRGPWRGERFEPEPPG